MGPTNIMHIGRMRSPTGAGSTFVRSPILCNWVDDDVPLDSVLRRRQTDVGMIILQFYDTAFGTATNDEHLDHRHAFHLGWQGT